MKRVFHGIFYAIFWLWNLTFLLVVYAGILPAIAPPLITATFAGLIPIEFFFTLVGIVVVPTICTFIGAYRFSKQPVQLMRLFYGVEAPLFLLCLIRLFLLRELTPASAQIISTVVICIAAFLIELLYGYTHRHRAIAWLQMTGHSLMLFSGLYIGAVLMFYAVPTIAGIAALIGEFFKFQWVEVFWSVFTQNVLAAFWWIPILFILFGLTSTLFVAMPSALATLYVLSGRHILRAFSSHYGRKRAWVGAGVVVTAWTVIFISLQQQPQVRAFNLLGNPAGNDSIRQVLLAKSDVIREGLNNAYLSSYRYLSTRKENNHISAMYRNTLGLSESAAQVLQDSYNHLISAFLYQGDRADINKAETLYAQFFDAPIQKAERQAIQHALQSTFNQDEVKAGLLNINQEKVWLNTQQVTVKEHGDWADVELYEVYENQTPQVQEVFYSFSLPESAVITGLWLGDTEKLSDRFPFVVSPRGAAQQVYNDQVKQRVDPALLEQVGPRHYRLRVFPIPVKSAPPRGASQPQEMHLWLTYKVMQQQGGWALPQLAEKRNIFWNDETKRVYKGAQKTQVAWLPTFISASGQNQPSLHQVNLPGGYRISAKPLTKQDYSLPQGQRFAIVLDTSRSMAAHSKEVTQTFANLMDNNSNDFDLYVTASPNSVKRINDIPSFNSGKIIFYGTIQPKEMLRQFTLRGDTSYDAVLLVTDEGSYELSDDSSDLPKMAAPLWVVHLGGILPPAYDDATLKAIQDSGGGVSTEVSEVLQRLATQAKLGDTVSVVDGYAWSELKHSEVTDQTGFEQLAARQLVLGLSKKIDTDKLTKLDDIHAIAKSFDIVTPYSSMLVLVNDQQREALKRAEAQSDRFKREVESGKEQLSQPFNPFTVSAVPEPEEWMLIGMAAIALLFIARRKRITVS
jgi:putative PEP-CTERM system integral membrane protein